MAAGDVTQAMVDFYRVHGAVKLPGLISREEAAAYRDEGMKLLLAGPTGELDIDGANQQRVQLWKWNETMRALTMLPRLGAAAERLAGRPLRLWHDDIIAKPPHNDGPTRPHQDMPLWALGNAPGALTAWIALQDTSVEMGCMSFAMGSQHWKDPAQGGGARPPAGHRQGLIAERGRGGLVAAHHHSAPGGRLHVSQRLHVPHGRSKSHRRVARGPSSGDGGRGGGLRPAPAAPGD